MPDADKHEWAAGLHAALFSLAVILGSIAWGNRFALILILIAQALAYLQRVVLLFVPSPVGAALVLVILTYASIIAAGLSAAILVCERIG